MLAFGPVPSRRLGRSLGVNNIPPKQCTYSCVYCQLGRTRRPPTVRRTFWSPEEIAAAVQERIASSLIAGERIDHLTIVPDGEPTLDVQLGRTLRALRPLGYPLAVISNGSLLDREDVRSDLAEADWVSLKVDAADEATWRRVDRPARRLDFQAIVHGMVAFARDFRGELTTETMLVTGINDAEEELRATAALVAELGPSVAYVAVPTRPPADDRVPPPTEASVARACEIFRKVAGRVEMLVGYEGDAFAATGDPTVDLLGVTSVHPMRESAVRRLIARDGADWSLVQGLLRQGSLVEVGYGGHRYYLRPIRRPVGT